MVTFVHHMQCFRTFHSNMVGGGWILLEHGPKKFGALVWRHKIFLLWIHTDNRNDMSIPDGNISDKGTALFYSTSLP